MKVQAAALTLVVIASSAFAGGRERYLVGTRSTPARTPLFQELQSDLDSAIQPFSLVHAFAGSFTAEQAEQLRQMPQIRYVELSPAREILDTGASGLRARQTVPFGVDLVKARQVWAFSESDSIRVAVIDTGADIAHPDLSPRIKGGYDFVQNDELPQDTLGHGTHVAGIIAASDNHIGTVGVAPRLELFPLRVASGNAIATERVIRALEWIAQRNSDSNPGNDIHVVNMSLGGPTTSEAEREAVDRVLAGGAIIVAASGNKPTDPVSYPAALDGVIAVGAVNERLELASFTSVGIELDLSAPGELILSTLPTGTGKSSEVRVSGVGSFDAILLERSPITPVEGAVLDCGLGHPEQFPAAVRGNIALISRGELFFSEKVKNAIAAGAVGVIISNNVAGSFSGTLGTEPIPWLPAIGISQETGATLRALGTVSVSVTSSVDDYGYSDGTSMASPHVAAAAALLWSIKPSASAAEVRSALESTAQDLGAPGLDPQFGHGLVDLAAAAKKLAPQKFTPRKLRTRRR